MKTLKDRMNKIDKVLIISLKLDMPQYQPYLQ